MGAVRLQKCGVYTDRVCSKSVKNRVNPLRLDRCVKLCQAECFAVQADRLFLPFSGFSPYPSAMLPCLFLFSSSNIIAELVVYTIQFLDTYSMQHAVHDNDNSEFGNVSG